MWREHVVHGVGCVLPGAGTGCGSWDDLARTMFDGICHIAPLDHSRIGVAGLDHSPIGVAGQVPDLVLAELDLPLRQLAKLPRMSAFAHLAVQRACAAAELSAQELSRARSMLIVCSVQFGLRELPDLVDRVRQNPDEAGLDYWISGTPGSVASCLSVNLELEMPTLTLTGGCSTSLRAYDLATTLILADELDYAIVVGADCVLEPIFLSSSGRKGRSGFRASTVSRSPLDVRPHDEEQCGNAPGEGALAVVLGRPNSTGTCRFSVTSAGAATRRLGASPVGLGDATVFSRDIANLLNTCEVDPADLHHVTDFTEGGRALEDFCVDVFQHLAQEWAELRRVPLTSQEACFGHIPGAAGLLKVVTSLHQLERGAVAPTTNLRQPYHRWDDWVLVPASASPLERAGDTSLVVATSGGGDTSSVLLRLSV